MVVTNSYFTASAKELAETASVRLVDRTGLQAYLDDYNQMIVQAAAQRQSGAAIKPEATESVKQVTKLLADC
jgi:hypothetical protein